MLSMLRHLYLLLDWIVGLECINIQNYTDLLGEYILNGRRQSQMVIDLVVFGREQTRWTNLKSKSLLI